MSDALHRLLAGADRLAELTGAAVVVIGGVARNVWAAPRATRDVDVLFGGAPLSAAIASAEDAALVAVGDEVRALAGAEMTRLRLPTDLTGAVRLDIIAAGHPFYQRVIARSRPLGPPFRHLRVAAPEDVVLLKCLADRPQDRADVAALIAACADELDVALIRSEASALELELPAELNAR